MSNGTLELSVAESFGPRIVGFSLEGGANILARLGDLGIDLPDGRRYTLYGGHRLWVAPEIPEVTYEPDDQPPDIASVDTQLTIASKPGHTFDKTIAVTLEGASATITHTLVNRGELPVDVAPWAITQLPTGGTAIIPLYDEPVDPHALQPNTSVVLWPYSGVDDSPFTMTDRLLLLDASRRTATKFGAALERGWLAYVREGLVFVKRAVHRSGGRYLDMGASGQCYCSRDFVELETLGEQGLLAPGASATHIETWELHQVDPGTPPHVIPGLLNLDRGGSS